MGTTMDNETELKQRLAEVETRMTNLTEALGRVTGARDELLRQLIDLDGAESSRFVGAR